MAYLYLALAIAGAVLYKQIPDIPAIIGMSFIVAGVVISISFQKQQSIRL